MAKSLWGYHEKILRILDELKGTSDDESQQDCYSVTDFVRDAAMACDQAAALLEEEDD